MYDASERTETTYLGILHYNNPTHYQYIRFLRKSPAANVQRSVYNNLGTHSSRVAPLCRCSFSARPVTTLTSLLKSGVPNPVTYKRGDMQV